MFNYTKVALALISLGASTFIWAEQMKELPTIRVTAIDQKNETNLLGHRPNVSDQTIQAKALKQRATTLGDALAGEAGVFSNQYGGGSSAPIIRGQEGKRIKVLANNADVVDMANMSPDHAISVDTKLAKQVELVRGASTLLYSSGNAAGVVNVIDNKIPSELPKNGFEAEAGLSFNTNSNEKVATLGTTIGLGKNFAVRLEGLNREAGNYKTPNHLHPIYELEDGRNFETHYEKLDYLPESWAKGKVGTVGLSWLGERGYLGASVTERREKYGLPAHSHAYEECKVSTIRPSLLLDGGKPFLKLYPFLADDKDMDYDNPGVKDCNHDNHHNGNHNNHDDEHEHEHAAPYIDLKSTRYEVRGELNQPFAGVDKIRVSASQTEYRHNEIEGDEVSGFFANKSNIARLEFSHQPIGALTGVWGVQYMDSKNSATSIATCEFKNCTPNTQNMLHNNQSKTWSIFGLEQYQWKDLTIEASARMERSKVTMLENREAMDALIKEYYCRPNSSYPCTAIGPSGLRVPFTTVDARNYVDSLLKPHKETAYSYALGGHWKFTPNHTLSFNYSHQERVPNAQELYAHGMHLATNSFEIGNKNLTKEKSNNFEIALGYQGEKLDYKVATYLYDFDNYIYLLAMNEGRGPNSIQQDEELKVNRYMQSPARFYGVEANVGYQFTPVYHVAVFGDYINGKLVDIPDVMEYTPKSIFSAEKITYKSQPDRYTPRLPPMRLGTRIKANFDEHWSGNIEFVRTFDQNKLSKFERKTSGHDMLNMGLNYQGQLARSEYDVFFKANNLLDQKVYAHETFLPYIPQMGRNFSLGLNWKF